MVSDTHPAEAEPRVHGQTPGCEQGRGMYPPLQLQLLPCRMGIDTKTCRKTATIHVKLSF